MRIKPIQFISLLLLIVFPVSALAANVEFYDTDNVGSPVAMWDTNGKKVWEGEYFPFGEEYSVTESPIANKKHFVGKEKDTETGLTYFGARYMDETSGRFTSPDPVRPVDAFTSKTNYDILTNPQRLNRYAYGLNNPFRYVDPDGEFAFLIPIATVSAEALGGLAGHVLGATTVAGIAAWMMNEGKSGEETVDDAQKETGSYTNIHESGKTYDGKGNKERSQKSGRKVERETGDRHIATDWTRSENNREAFKDESRRLDFNGGPKSKNNYNKIESPGKKMRRTDGN